MRRKKTTPNRLLSFYTALILAMVTAAPVFAANAGTINGTASSLVSDCGSRNSTAEANALTGSTAPAASVSGSNPTVSAASVSYTYVPTKAIRYYWQAGKWRMDYTAKYTYKNGRLVKTVYGSDNLVEKYTYYKNGCLKKISYYSNSEELVETKTYKNYNRRGDAKTVKVSAEEDTYTIRYKYIYNKKGQIKKQTAKYIYAGDYSEKVVTSYTYDAKGYPVTLTEDSVTSNTVTYKNTYYKGKYLKSATAAGWQKTVYSGFKKVKLR